MCLMSMMAAAAAWLSLLTCSYAVLCTAAAMWDLSSPDERLDEEQGRVAALESVVTQLEEKMEELSQLALSAGPSMSALEVSAVTSHTCQAASKYYQCMCLRHEAL